ncbi:MAG: hypothetical protein H7327_09505, partial [Herminiimonas sp.]|nr:hypothetical protein [Herminiimonas sp.]
MKNRLSSIKACVHSSLLFWPALSLIAIALLWTMSAVRTANERTTLEQTAIHDAASSAEAYEHFLSRSIGQMDQVTMQLKFQWEHSREKFRFEELNQQGVFTDAAFISVSIYGRDGSLQTSTKIASTPMSLANADFFAFHKNNISTALKITVAAVSQASRRFLQFSRRLDGPDDTFDGMVVLNIDPDYFTSFYSAHSLGNAGLVAMVLVESDGRIEKDGIGMQGLGPIVTMPLPAFGSEDEARVWTRKQYADGQQRFLAWKRSRSYPFIAVVGLSRAEIFSSLATVSENRNNNSLLGTFALLVFAAVATRLSWRLKSRQKEQEAIRAAYRTATEQATDGFYLLLPVQDDHRRITDFQFQDCNEQGASFFGVSQSELLGKRLSGVSGASLNSWLIDRYARTKASGTYEEEVQTPSDSALQLAWINCKLARAGDSLAITLQDISRHKLHEQQLLRLANEDALTGLPNRYWLNQHLPDALVRAAKNNSAMALLF